MVFILILILHLPYISTIILLLLTAEGFAFAITRNKPAKSELDIHIFDPFKIYSLPSFFAVVLRANASDPAVVSDNAKLLHCKNVF